VELLRAYEGRPYPTDVRVRECASNEAEEAEGDEETLGKGDARIAVQHSGPAVEHEVGKQVLSFIVGV